MSPIGPADLLVPMAPLIRSGGMSPPLPAS